MLARRYRVKYNLNLCAYNNVLQEGVDVKETYVFAVKIAIVCLFLAVVAAKIGIFINRMLTKPFSLVILMKKFI